MTVKSTIVVLSGEYDIRRRDELDHVLDRYGDADQLVFDLSAVEAFDTVALRSLVRFQAARREAGKPPMVLAGASHYVRGVLELSKLKDAFELRD